MPIAAHARAQLALTATTTLPPEAALDVVRHATKLVKGGGASLLTSGIANLGAQVHIERDAGNRLALSITSGKRIVELCTFSARVSERHGQTKLTVGGLETYKTNQSYMLGFIPIGPKAITGIAPYKSFLNEIALALCGLDPDVEVNVGTQMDD